MRKGKERQANLSVAAFVTWVRMPVFGRMAGRKLQFRRNVGVRGRHMEHAASEWSAVHSRALTHRRAHRMLRFCAAARRGQLCAGRVGDSVMGRASGLERAAIHSGSLPRYLELGSEIREGRRKKKNRGNGDVQAIHWQTYSCATERGA